MTVEPCTSENAALAVVHSLEQVTCAVEEKTPWHATLP